MHQIRNTEQRGKVLAEKGQTEQRTGSNVPEQ